MGKNLLPLRKLPNTEAKVLFNRAKLMLTDRELECTKLIAHGYTNKEIAAKLCVTDATVKAHLRSAMGKLNVRDRVRLAVYVIKAGLVLVDDIIYE